MRAVGIIVALLLFLTGFSQKINRLNKNKLRTGKWLLYSDSAKTKKLFEGRFRNGLSVGTTFYYNMDGILDRKETKRFKILKTRIYYASGQLQQKGRARVVQSPEKVHYYFYGKWKYFNPEGKIEKYIYYEKGRLVRTVYSDKNNKANDSLAFALNELEKRFNEVNKLLLDSISLSAFNPQRKERLQAELQMQDTTTFSSLERILNRYGYPKKESTHESAIIPFYILSHAPMYLREKYLPLLKLAADQGDIEWKSLAFYIDKIKVGKGEPQIYGTQYYYGKDRMHHDYQIENPEQLKERRKSVGLD